MKSLRSLISCNGRKAIITGSSGHLGKVISRTLADMGYNLILVDMKQETLDQLSYDLENQYNIESFKICCDLESQEERNKLIKKVSQEHPIIDCLINNAAFVGTNNLDGWNVPFKEQSLESWKRSFEVNLTAPFHLSQKISNLMQGASNPNIINVGSIYGHCSPDWSLYEETEIHNIAAYSASKGGLIQLTRWLATTLSPEIRVNAISPGGIFRDQNPLFVKRYSSKVPLNRMASEDDFIGSFAYLASDMSKYVTGQSLKVDGGWALS